ncbi:MAG: 2-C-methyl-D-erythritol 2,4-cyclodiphosphate synthase [Firmicutes bacterium]|nr:2-C-methyl-D-erythritol 2,4-cyclodiphosphate synthase [Bacillota bacterium]
MQRIGSGFDVHRYEEGRPMVLGGVTIPYEKGLKGHSDADVVLHAVMDSMLGAAGMGDIGEHFPDSDDRYKGISSMELLRRVAEMIAGAGYTVGNIDVTVICEEPKIGPHKQAMKDAVRSVLGDVDINIKGTTTEGLGYTGRKEGIACHSICLLTRE